MSTIINTIISFFLIFSTMFLPAKTDGVEITVKEMTVSSAGITFVCENKTNRKISRPHIVSIEKNVGGNWEKVDIGLGATDIAYDLYPGQDSTESADFGKLDENSFEFINQHLDEGEYKLTISYNLTDYLKGKVEQGYSSAVFTVYKTN